MRGYLAEIRHLVYFWKLSGERVCGVLLKQTLESMLMFGKSISIPNRQLTMLWHWFVLQVFTEDAPVLVCFTFLDGL